jgi:hypothetical protein
MKWCFGVATKIGKLVTVKIAIKNLKLLKEGQNR